MHILLKIIFYNFSFLTFAPYSPKLLTVLAKCNSNNRVQNNTISSELEIRLTDKKTEGNLESYKENYILTEKKLISFII